MPQRNHRGSIAVSNHALGMSPRGSTSIMQLYAAPGIHCSLPTLRTSRQKLFDPSHCFVWIRSCDCGEVGGLLGLLNMPVPLRMPRNRQRHNQLMLKIPVPLRMPSGTAAPTGSRSNASSRSRCSGSKKIFTSIKGSQWNNIYIYIYINQYIP